MPPSLGLTVRGRPASAPQHTPGSATTNVERVRKRAAVHRLVAECTSALDADALIAHLDAAGVASAMINEVTDLLRHPQLAGRCRWHPVDTGRDGTFTGAPRDSLTS